MFISHAQCEEPNAEGSRNLRDRDGIEGQLKGSNLFYTYNVNVYRNPKFLLNMPELLSFDTNFFVRSWVTITTPDTTSWRNIFSPGLPPIKNTRCSGDY